MKKAILAITAIIPSLVWACYSPYENDLKDALMLIALFTGTFSFISLIVLSIFSFLKKYKGRSFRKWIIFSAAVFLLSLVLLTFAIVRTLCAPANF